MLLIQNAKIITMENKDYLEGADILVKDGKIAAVGTNLDAQGAKVIDAHGLYAMPGIIDAHAHIGMWEDSLGFEGSDGNEITNPVTPALRAIDAINPRDRCFEEAAAYGVTLTATGPGSANVVGGQFALMHTFGRSLDARLVKEPLALKIAFGENPKTCYNERKETPTTRMGTAAVLRQALVDAQEYARKLALEDEDKRPERDLSKEVLAKALSGEIFVKAHAHRADDILTALRIGHEFGLRMSLEHCTEGHLITQELAEEQKKYGTPVIVGPLFSDRSKPELSNMTYRAPGILEQAGVRFAMMTDHPVIPEKHLLVCAIIAHREGLSERGALLSVTRNAAWALGVEDRFGSIAVGKEADIALYDREPLDARARVCATIGSGEIVFER